MGVECISRNYGGWGSFPSTYFINHCFRHSRSQIKCLFVRLFHHTNTRPTCTTPIVITKQQTRRLWECFSLTNLGEGETEPGGEENIPRNTSSGETVIILHGPTSFVIYVL